MLKGRLAALIEYDGRQFNGWQTQKSGRCIQWALENALSKVADAPIVVAAAGRTDKGVHASAQLIHFDTQSQRSAYGWMSGANTHLPACIRVRWVGGVDHDFHARHSALARRYRYLIYNAPTRSAFLSEQVTYIREPLDTTAMHAACQYLIGEHDFSSFRDSQCQSKTPFRRIFSCDVSKRDNFITIDITANAFLHHMVRNIVGTLLPIGKSFEPIEWLNTALKAQDRRQAGITAPPNGLYLVKIYYPEQFGVPDHEIGPYFHPGQRCQPPCDTRIIVKTPQETDRELVR